MTLCPAALQRLIGDPMQVGKPDPDAPAPAEPSLVQRLAAMARRPRVREGARPAATGWSDQRVAIAVALLIAAGPLLTIGGARLIAERQRSAADRIETEMAPRIAAAQAARAARTQMAAVLRRPTMGATIEALARALPADATLVRAGTGTQGRLALEIAAADPDKLRSALRRTSALARLRDIGQRQADGRLIVLLEGAPE